MVTIYDFDDYRLFLKAFYERQKKDRPSFSYAVFAKKAGLPSRMHLQLVISGKRNLSSKSVPKFVNGLGLAKKEGEFFETLVNFNQSRDAETKSAYLAKLRKLTKRPAATRLGTALEQSLFARWYLPLVYELANRADFKEDPEWIARELGGLVSVSEAKEGLRLLLNGGLIVRNEKGAYQTFSPAIRSQDDIENFLLRECHRHFLKGAETHLEDPLDEREYGFVTVSTSADKIPWLKLKIRSFLSGLNQELSEGSSKGDKLIQVNLQMFQWNLCKTSRKLKPTST